MSATCLSESVRLRRESFARVAPKLAPSVRADRREAVRRYGSLRGSWSTADRLRLHQHTGSCGRCRYRCRHDALAELRGR
jgi:hypothetical protein